MKIGVTLTMPLQVGPYQNAKVGAWAEVEVDEAGNFSVPPALHSSIQKLQKLVLDETANEITHIKGLIEKNQGEIPQEGD